MLPSRPLHASAVLAATLFAACARDTLRVPGKADTDVRDDTGTGGDDTEGHTDRDTDPVVDPDPCVSLSFTPEASVSIPRFPEQALADGDFTLEAWVVLHGTNPSHTLAFSDPQADAAGWRLVVLGEPGARTLRFQLGGGAQPGPTVQAAAGTVPENRWVHLALTYGQVADELSMFVDGQVAARRTLGGRPREGASVGPLVLGGTRPGDPGWMTGFLDEVRISSTIRYTDPFSPASRHELDDATVALWHLDAGEGAVATEATGAHDGTIDGAVWSTNSGCDGQTD